MKENPNTTLFDCDFGGKETDPIRFKESGNYESSDENKVKDSILTKANTCTDKNVLENGVPDLIDCYKEVVSGVMRDICLDEGTPLGSFFTSFDGKENNKTQLCSPDQEMSPSSYDSKIERTFDFEKARVSINKPENVMLQSFDSTNMHGLKNSGAHNSVREMSIEKGNKELSKVENGFPDFPESENGPDQSLSDFKDDDSFKVNGNESVVDREKYEHDEPSFSDSAFVSHSGAIPFSGSISFRSDGSATSGRSFAFPILQSEWTSSPIKMGKADRRQLRKHKFWRSRLLCCRF